MTAAETEPMFTDAQIDEVFAQITGTSRSASSHDHWLFREFRNVMIREILVRRREIEVSKKLAQMRRSKKFRNKQTTEDEDRAAEEGEGQGKIA